MSGTGSNSGSPVQQSPWAGGSQSAGTNTVQPTAGSAAPGVPGMTPGSAPTPFQSPSTPLSGFGPQSNNQAVNPNQMSAGMPGVNAQTGTGNVVGAPPYLTAPPPVPTGYGLGPNQQLNGLGYPSAATPPTLGMPGR